MPFPFPDPSDSLPPFPALAMTNFANMKWLVRANLLGGGDPNFTTTDIYQNYSSGDDGTSYYWGANSKAASNGGIGPDGLGVGGTLVMFDKRTDIQQISNANFGQVGYFRDVIQGGDGVTSGPSGGRIGIIAQIVQNSKMIQGNLNPFKVGAVFQVITNTGDGGTNTGAGAVGNYVGFNPFVFANSGAQNIGAVNGGEIDVITHSAATVRYTVGLNIVDGCASKGTALHMGLQIYRYQDPVSNAPGPGFDIGIGWTDINSSAPVAVTSTLIGSKVLNGTGPWTAFRGIDFSNFVFTGSILRGASLDLQESVLRLGSLGGFSTIDNNAAAAGSSWAFNSLAHINLRPAAGSYVSFGTYVAGAPAATGYFSMTTADGVVRKVLVG